jgi:DNA-binding NtrC family response regulator
MAFAKRKILIVDDDASFLEMLHNYFTSHQYEVAAAPTVEKAIQLMREGRFKVVILDYQMPQAKGDDLIGILQRLNPSAKFIVVTGHLGEDVEEKFKGLGYFAYFEKAQLPFKELESTVLKAFHA